MDSVSFGIWPVGAQCDAPNTGKGELVYCKYCSLVNGKILVTLGYTYITLQIGRSWKAFVTTQIFQLYIRFSFPHKPTILNHTTTMGLYI